MQRDTLQIRTADNVGIGYEPAGIASRFLAVMLDYVIQAAIIFFVFIVVQAAAPDASSTTVALLLFILVPFIVSTGYFVVLETATSGRTPGKRAVGIRVIRVDGSAPQLTEALVRNIIRTLDMPLGVVAMFINSQSRRLGDLAAGTLVVREKTTYSAPPAMPPVLLRTPDAGPQIEGVERLGLTEYSALRTFLSRYGLTPQQRQHLAVEMAKRLHERLQLPASAPERQWPAELFLERLYLQLAGRLQAAP
jgi:uncharacterized RDD family membrane protein YckC